MPVSQAFNSVFIDKITADCFTYHNTLQFTLRFYPKQTV